MKKGLTFEKLGFIFTMILIILLPFHAFLTTSLTALVSGYSQDLLSKTSYFVACWKEILMVIMTLMIIIRSFIQKKLPFKILLIDYFILFLFVWALASAFIQSASLTQGILGIRFDFEFFFLYWIIRALNISQDNLKTILKTLFIVTSIVIILGFVQIFLSCDQMTIFGYTSYISSWVASKPLPCGHAVGVSDTIRMMSTFSGPNQLASYLIVAIMMAWYSLSKVLRTANAKIWMKYIYMVFIALSLTALYLTYSRGAMIALLVAFLCLLVLQATDTKKTFGYLVFGIVISILIFTANIVLSPERIDSTKEHFEKPLQGITMIIEKPWGYGIGMAGPVSMRFPADGSKALVSESWYLQIAQEFGVLGGLMFFLLLSYILRYLFQRQSNNTVLDEKEFLQTILSVYLGLLINNLFLHTWSSDMVTSLIFWSLFGIAVSFKHQDS